MPPYQRPSPRTNRVVVLVSALVALVAAVAVVVVVATTGGSTNVAGPPAAPSGTAGVLGTSTTESLPLSTTPSAPVTTAGGSGGTIGPYPAKAQRSYLSSCEGGSGNATYCQCTLQYFEGHVPFATFVGQTAATGRPPDFAAAIEACESATGG